MTTATKTPSTELAKLQRRRDVTYDELRKIKVERERWAADLDAEQAAYTEHVNSHPDEWRDAARNPRPASAAAKKLAALKKKQAAGNPHEPDYVAARERFHRADEEQSSFLRRNLAALIAEDEDDYLAVVDKAREAFAALIAAGDEYAALIERARSLIIRTPGIDAQAITHDLRPAEWSRLAAAALDEPLARVGLTELGHYKLTDR